MRLFIGKVLQLAGMMTLAAALAAGLTEPTLWNELVLMLVGVLVFWGGWIVENKLPGRP
ncbi:MAG: hypothetical protein ACE5HD_05460 [Acidobacteriota bacterium]